MALFLNWLNDKVSAEESLISGRGIIALEPLKKNEQLALFGGHIISIKQFEGLSQLLKQYPLQISDYCFIGATSEDEIDDGDFVNHSCEPNAGIKGQISLVAIRDIAAREEITFDYAMTESYCKGFVCKCNSSCCRKNIKNNDWKITSLQKKYKGFISDYLQVKIIN